MTTEDAPIFFERLLALGELFGSKLSEAAQTLYFDALIDLDIADVVSAMAEGAMKCKFMPRPAELRDFVSGTLENEAEREWEILMEHARSEGSMGGRWRREVNEETKDAMRAVFGDWTNFCLMELTPEMRSAKRKEFLRSYTRFRDATIREDRLLADAERKMLKP